MPDPRFFCSQGPLALARLCEIAGAELAPDAEGERLIRDVAPLETAGPDELSFLDNRRYRARLAKSRAGACILRPEDAPFAPPGMSLVLTPDPYRAYARAAGALHPPRRPAPGIHATAVIDPTALLGPDCTVEAGAVIGAEAEIGARCWIGANAVIGRRVVLGEDTRVGACASLAYAIIGARVRIYPGARIGERGFGFAPDPKGHVSVPQLGRVVIHDDVEVGANTTIDRGSGHDTVIGPGCMIDNLVQIGHNVRLGRGCVIVSQVGISGSTRIGDYVFIGGQAGLAGHLKIGAGARIAARAGLFRDVPDGETVAGLPAVPIRQWHRQTAALARLVRKSGG